MSEIRVASRYAKSLLELAVERNVLEEVLKDMQQFVALCNENRELVLMLNNPIIKHDKKRSILNQIFAGKVNELSMAMFDIVTRKNREPYLLGMAKEFQNQYNEHLSIEKAKVTTAIALPSDLKKEIEGMVKSISTRKNVELVEVIDQSVIGGYVLTVGDKQIDETIKSKLKALELQFSKNPYIKEF